MRKLVDLFTRQKKNMENILVLEIFAKHKHNFVSMKLLLKYCCDQLACLMFDGFLRSGSDINTYLDIASFSSQKMHYVSFKVIKRQ